jgi:hypothetical protein
MTAYSGPLTITADGTTIENKICEAGFVIEADNVTFRRCLILSGGYFWGILSDSGNTGLTIMDCEFDGEGNTATDSAVSGSGYSVIRCNIHGTGDGMKVGSAVTVQDSYIHDLAITEGGGHNDGIQSLGTTGLTISHNSIILVGDATACIILSTGSASDMRNIAIGNNLFAGGSYCVYGGYQSGVDDINKVSSISIVGNRISTQIYANGGNTGPFTSIDPPVVCTNNVWHDGPSVGSRIN